MLLTLTRDGRRCMFSIIQRETLDNASVDVLNKLIEVGGRDLLILEDDEYEATALHDALEYNASVDVISELIEVGGRDLVMVKNINEWTALHDAIICNASVVNKLIEVEWRLLLNIKVNDEWTALLVAREKSLCVDVIN